MGRGAGAGRGLVLHLFDGITQQAVDVLAEGSASGISGLLQLLEKSCWEIERDGPGRLLAHAIGAGVMKASTISSSCWWVVASASVIVK